MSQQDQSTNTATRYLTSLNRHLRRHGLGDTLSSVSLPQHEHSRPYVQVYPHVDPDHLAALVRWLPTLTRVAVTVTCADDGRNLHLLATGGLDDGTVTGVVALLHGTDRAWIQARCETAVGSVIAVDLLLTRDDAAGDERRVEPAMAGVLS